MKIRNAVLVVSVAAFFGISNAPAATFYVSLASTNPVPPYASWSTAATSIQDAIDAASTNDLILVTDGVYQTGTTIMNEGTNFMTGATLLSTNRVTVSEPVTIQSVNGPAVTLIDGSSAMRCVYLTNDATLVGFTLENGHSPGGTSPSFYGGGAWCADSSEVLSNCVVTGGLAALGGGVAFGTLYNCQLTGNDSTYNGGGAYESTLNNCLVMENDADEGGGAYKSILNNCLVVSNSGNGTFACTVNNCTVVHNTHGGAVGGSMNNCIIYYNDYNYYTSVPFSQSFSYCDTTPSPGQNSITNEPLFVDTNDDFHLQSNSPCINSGDNALVAGATDFDGNPRTVGGTLDLGAYEYQTPTSVISYAYLQQYGLPTDGSVDFTDLDGTAFNVYQDWIAGLNPTNPASVLAMQTPAATNNASGITVTWQSVNGITYFLQSSTNLPSFSTIQNNVTGQAGTTSYTDTSATNNVPYFYRVGVVAP